MILSSFYCGHARSATDLEIFRQSTAAYSILNRAGLSMQAD